MHDEAVKLKNLYKIGYSQFELESQVFIASNATKVIFDGVDIKPYMGLQGYKLLFIYNSWCNSSNTVPIDTIIWSDNTVGLNLYNFSVNSSTIHSIRIEYIAQKL